MLVPLFDCVTELERICDSFNLGYSDVFPYWLFEFTIKQSLLYGWVSPDSTPNTPSSDHTPRSSSPNDKR